MTDFYLNRQIQVLRTYEKTDATLNYLNTKGVADSLEIG
jgi:hypothetical protein